MKRKLVRSPRCKAASLVARDSFVGYPVFRTRTMVYVEFFFLVLSTWNFAPCLHSLVKHVLKAPIVCGSVVQYHSDSGASPAFNVTQDRLFWFFIYFNIPTEYSHPGYIAKMNLHTSKLAHSLFTRCTVPGWYVSLLEGVHDVPAVFKSIVYVVCMDIAFVSNLRCKNTAHASNSESCDNQHSPIILLLLSFKPTHNDITTVQDYINPW